MTVSDRVRWDEIYQQRQDRPFPPPDPLLLNYTPAPPEGQTGRALDLAAGVGQNGLWLAKQGYSVDLADISRVGLARAKQEMATRGLRNVNLLQIDLDDHDFDEEIYDLVCVFRFLKRNLFTSIGSTVKPGGRLIYSTFNIHYLDIVPEFNQDYLLWPGELAEAYEGWQIMYHDHASKSSHFVAVKPPPED